MKKVVKLYPEAKESVLENFYEAIRGNRLHRMHLPHSSVFYVRAAIEARYGKRFTLKHVENAMKAEGMLKDV